MTVNEDQDVEIIAALFNSIVKFLTMEIRGTSRNLGALDLNANYFKTLRVLNPDLLNEDQIENIKNAFQPLKEREILRIAEEIQREDRINFDLTVLRSFGIDETILPRLYTILSESVIDRVNMAER